MKWLTSLLCLLLCTCSKKPLDVHVMTANIRYINGGDRGAKTWINRRDDMARLMREQDLDFIGLQEAFRVMIDDIHERMPGYGEIGVGRENGKQKGEYAAILFKQAAWTTMDHGTFWLSDTPEVIASSTWGNHVTRICTWGKFRHNSTQRVLLVFNAHFDHESQPAREKSASLILQSMRQQDPDIPVILLGDLNAPPDNPAIRLITSGERPLRDAWAVVPLLPPEQSGTYHGFSGKHNGARIDYIFTSDHIQPQSAKIHHDNREGMYPSDHYPVSARLRWP